MLNFQAKAGKEGSVNIQESAELQTSKFYCKTDSGIYVRTAWGIYTDKNPIRVCGCDTGKVPIL